MKRWKRCGASLGRTVADPQASRQDEARYAGRPQGRGRFDCAASLGISVSPLLFESENDAPRPPRFLDEALGREALVVPSVWCDCTTRGSSRRAPIGDTEGDRTLDAPFGASGLR